MRRLVLICICVNLALASGAQLPVKEKPLSNFRKKAISTRQPHVLLDTLSLIPNTVVIPGLNESDYTVDYVNAKLTWNKVPPFDSVYLTYRVFNYRLNALAKRLDYDSISNNFLINPYVYKNRSNVKDDRFFNFGNITYNGSFGRGIAFGNSQDAVVTSNLNLQMSGYLADSIEIVAAITDNNIPIQPDGTTQQLNEFDRIFLQFKKAGWQLSLGDIDLRQNKSYFLNFYKRLQGAAFETRNIISPGISSATLVSGSVAKGKFTRNIFQGLEGNQGPYRLTGANNELFFVVLANTERVFIDGVLLQRGEDQDYIINYNTAEVSFTPKRMITKDSRIQVEFEYADRNYLNTNLYVANETDIGKRLKIRLGAFNNGDAKSSPINQQLDPLQKQFLNNLGDSTRKAYYPFASIDTFSAGKILYRKTDTTYSGSRVKDTIFVYSTNPDSAIYNLSFIDVGENNGDYVPDFSGVNGKVYRWVAPVNHVRQGRYLPAAFLVAPKKQQVASLGLDYSLNKNTIVTTEFGYSNYNSNTFSTRDKGDDKGYAARIQVKNIRQLGKTAKKLKLSAETGLEFVDRTFRPLERLRNVEFTRDWGLPYIVEPANEVLSNASLQLADDKDNLVRYQLAHYSRGDGFKGLKNSITHYQQLNSWRMNNQLSFTNFNGFAEKGNFFRPALDVSKELRNLKNYIVGSSFSMERNEVRNKATDSVTFASFDFQTLSLYMKSSEKNLNRWGISWFTRKNKYPFGKDLLDADRSQNFNLFTELLKSEKHQFRLNVTYRDLQVFRQTGTSQQADKSLLGRTEYQVNVWKGLLSGNVLYEVGAGQEQKKDFAFLEVPAGQGQFTWIDYDNNGLQSLNEFEIAQFQDQARYIRINTPTNDFIKANYNTLNYSLAINPRAYADNHNPGNFKTLVNRMSLQSSLQIMKKEIARNVIQLNPFVTSLNDTSLISLNSVFINSFSFNRFSTKWGIDFSNSRNTSKALLTYGYESRKFEEWTLRGRLGLFKAVAFDLVMKNGVNGLATSNVKFDNRNYSVNMYSLEPRLTYTPGTNFRLISGYKYSGKENQENDMEVYSSHAIITELKYNILQTSSILMKFTYSAIAFSNRKGVSANQNSTVSYIMLDGLLPGKNFLWNIDLLKRLSNNLELNIQYEGRQPGSGRVVHTGRASLRALL